MGEITDETDKEEPEIIKTGDSEWIVPGKSDIEEVNEAWERIERNDVKYRFVIDMASL